MTIRNVSVVFGRMLLPFLLLVALPSAAPATAATTAETYC